MSNQVPDNGVMKLPPITISPALRLTLPTGTVALTTAQAFQLVDELTYKAILRQQAEREQRRTAARARRLAAPGENK